MNALLFLNPGECWGLVLDHLWQSSLFALIVLFLIALMRGAPSRVRYLLYVAIPVKFLLPSDMLLDLVRRLGVDLSSAFLSIAYATGDPLVLVDRQASVFHLASVLLDKLHNPVSLLLWIGMAVWLSGSLLFLGNWWLRHLRLYREVRSARPLRNCRESEILNRVTERLPLKRKIHLVASPDFAEIGVFGVWRPYVLLPEPISHQLSDSELEAILLHELVHISRWDNLLSHLSMAACCLFWFHPLVWLADRRIVSERERVCDDRVLELGGASGTYAQSLVKVLRFGLGFRVAGVSCAGGSNLKRRIEQIASGIPAPQPRLAHRLAVVGVLVILVAASLAAVRVDRCALDPVYRKPAPGWSTGN